MININEFLNRSEMVSSRIITKAENAGIILAADPVHDTIYNTYIPIPKEKILSGSASEIDAAADGIFSQPFKAFILVQARLPKQLMHLAPTVPYEVSVSYDDKSGECKILTQVIQLADEYISVSSIVDDILKLRIIDKKFETRKVSNEYPEPAAFKGNIESKSSMDATVLTDDTIDNLYDIYNLVKDNDGMRETFEKMMFAAYPDRAETTLQLFHKINKVLGKKVD